VDSTSILLFFRSTESHGKTRSVFTPPMELWLSADTGEHVQGFFKSQLNETLQMYIGFQNLI
jgi:hypothetical protein